MAKNRDIFYIATNEIPARYLEVQKIGLQNILGIPEENRFHLVLNKEKATISLDAKTARKLRSVTEVLYPQVRAIVMQTRGKWKHPDKAEPPRRGNSRCLAARKRQSA